MSLADEIGRGIGRARAFARDCRKRYLDTSMRVVERGSSGLKGLSHYTGVLGPQLRHILDEGIEELQQRLDQLNCSLAEKAVPDDRRAQVRQLRQPPSTSRQGNLRVVESGTAGQKAKQVRSGSDKPAKSRNSAAKPKRAGKAGKTAPKPRSTTGKRPTKRSPGPK